MAVRVFFPLWASSTFLFLDLWRRRPHCVSIWDPGFTVASLGWTVFSKQESFLLSLFSTRNTAEFDGELRPHRHHLLLLRRRQRGPHLEMIIAQSPPQIFVCPEKGEDKKKSSLFAVKSSSYHLGEVQANFFPKTFNNNRKEEIRKANAAASCKQQRFFRFFSPTTATVISHTKKRNRTDGFISGAEVI